MDEPDQELELVTRAEAARRWGISRQAVHWYIVYGLPTTRYGKLLDWRVVEAWRRMYISPYASGNWRFRQRQKEQRPMTPGNIC